MAITVSSDDEAEVSNGNRPRPSAYKGADFFLRQPAANSFPSSVDNDYHEFGFHQPVARTSRLPVKEEDDDPFDFRPSATGGFRLPFGDSDHRLPGRSSNAKGVSLPLKEEDDDLPSIHPSTASHFRLPSFGDSDHRLTSRSSNAKRPGPLIQEEDDDRVSLRSSTAKAPRLSDAISRSSDGEEDDDEPLSTRRVPPYQRDDLPEAQLRFSGK